MEGGNGKDGEVLEVFQSFFAAWQATHGELSDHDLACHEKIILQEPDKGLISGSKVVAPDVGVGENVHSVVMEGLSSATSPRGAAVEEL